MLDVIIVELPDEEKWDSRVHIGLQFMMAAASVHTAGQILCECMYDLAVRPGFQEEIRQEAYEMLERDQRRNKRDSTVKMRKLDSFIREAQRFNGNMGESSFSTIDQWPNIINQSATFRRKS